MEVNPLAVTTDGKLVALDAKFNFDDSALYRQKKSPPCARRGFPRSCRQ